jgi:hypothetical protein
MEKMDPPSDGGSLENQLIRPDKGIPMLLHPTKKDLRLLTIEDIKSDGWQNCLPWRTTPFYLAVAWWIETFVSRRHADLGRDGFVCPFVPPSIDRQLLWLAGHEDEVRRPEDLAGVMLDYRDWFLELPPQAGNEKVYKAIVVLFPDLQSESGFNLIDAAQRQLKSAFVSQGLMIGQFYPLCDEPGVRRLEFRPLRSPVPLLVIRYMTRFDLPFLTDPKFLAPYQTQFGNNVPERYRDLYAEACGKLGPDLISTHYGS